MADTADHRRAGLARANLARIYDYFLGGSLNNTRDRTAASELEAAWPQLPHIIRWQRRFLRTAIERLLDLGVRQFVDLGSGVPTAGHIHEIAHTKTKAPTVVYIDNDPVTIAHAQTILRAEPATAAILADLRDPKQVLHHETTRRLLDRQQAVGIIMIGILEHLPDSDPTTLLTSYSQASDAITYIAVTLISRNDNPENDTPLTPIINIYRNLGAPFIIHHPDSLQGWLHTKRILQTDQTNRPPYTLYGALIQ